jgi:hypothetical protein
MIILELWPLYWAFPIVFNGHAQDCLFKAKYLLNALLSALNKAVFRALFSLASFLFCTVTLTGEATINHVEKEKLLLCQQSYVWAFALIGNN